MAVCEHHEGIQTGFTHVYCRTTENVYETLVKPAIDEEKRIVEEEKKKSESLSNEKKVL